MLQNGAIGKGAAVEGCTSAREQIAVRLHAYGRDGFAPEACIARGRLDASCCLGLSRAITRRTPIKASVHVLHEESDHRLAVFAVSWLPGRGVPPHDHGTWAIVVGVDGPEKNLF